MTGPNRLDRLRNQTSPPSLTGIDFVYVHESQTIIDIYFHIDPLALSQPLSTSFTAAAIAIKPIVSTAQVRPRIQSISWTTGHNGRNVLQIVVDRPGDFALYQISIDDTRIDPFFNDVKFSFKASCPSDLDCKSPGHFCPPESEIDAQIDYLARDFWSFRKALLDFASQKYPDWKDRLPADVGVMLAEVMSAIGDEHSFIQDRIAREAYLRTATQRRSLRRHARLVDYHLHDGLGASTWLDVTVAAGTPTGALPAGADVYATRNDGIRINYEVGRGLRDIMDGTLYAVAAVRNKLTPYIWDESKVCLPRLSTSLTLAGHHAANLPFDDDPASRFPGRYIGTPPGRWVLLRTKPKDPALPERAWMVRLFSAIDTIDPLPDPNAATPQAIPVTKIEWEAAYATPFEMDLATLEVRGNMVPATAGRTFVNRFVADAQLPTNMPVTVERSGPMLKSSRPTAYIYSLPGSDKTPLVQRPNEDDLSQIGFGRGPRKARPEVNLTEVSSVPSHRIWHWKRSFVGVRSSQARDPHFVIDDGMWERIVTYRRMRTDLTQLPDLAYRDYRTGSGVSIRFGDGEFGLVPKSDTVFEVRYRLGNGRAGNVAADALTTLDMPNLYPFVQSITNPLPASDGVDPETPFEVRHHAPEAYKAVTYRAVRPADYSEAAERLDWVQRAGSKFRWTGSWLSVFTTADPKETVSLSPGRRRALLQQLERFRQAGREVHVAPPRYADMDLEITICVAPTAFVGDVKEEVLGVLVGPKQGVKAYFHPDNFTFGTPLRRSHLEGVIQSVSGVRAVQCMRIRRRGLTAWQAFRALTYPVADNEVFRLENDPVFPERGTLSLIMVGGA